MNNYKLLPALLSILETKNLTDSARALNVTQSAMSKTFRQIREELGDQIMVREGNQYVLTSKGQELVRELPLLLQKLDTLFSSQTLSADKIERQFTLAFSSFVAKSVLPIICADIEALAPGVSVVSHYWQDSHFDNLAGSTADIVLTLADNIPENLYGRELGTDEFVVMCKNTHPLAQGALTMEDYLNAKHVQVSGAVGWERQLFMGEQHKLRRVFACTPSFHSAVKVLLTTNTLMTVPLHIASQYADKYPIKLKRFPIRLPQHKYYLLWHARHQQDPGHRWFRELCIDRIGDDLRRRIDFGKAFFDGKTL